MKIALIIPLEPGATGGRFLTSYLRAKGHDARLIFIPDLIPELEGMRYASNVRYECSQKLKDILLGLTQDCDLIGFSLLAAFHEAVSQLSAHLRIETEKPVIWGGVHPTMFYQECLKYCDFVCSGDGEETLVEFMNTLEAGGDTKLVPGLWRSEGNRPVMTAPRPAIEDLDALPFPDYTFADDYWVDASPGAEQALPLTPSLYREVHKKYPDLQGNVDLVPYKTVTTRGCPFFCSYCAMGTLSKAESPFRKRSVNNVMLELEEVVKQHGDMFDVVSLADDTFMSHSKIWIGEFAEQFKKRIDRPFRVIGFPESVTAEKIENLCSAGAMHFGMGVESLSEKTLKLYDRHTAPDRVVKSANILVDAARRYRIIPPTFDVILGNPFEKPADVLTTFRRVLGIGLPAKYVLFHLVFFPGSKLYNRAVKEGVIDASDDECFRSWYSNKDRISMFIEFLFEAAVKDKTYKWLLHLMSREWITAILSSLYESSKLLRNVIRVLVLDFQGVLTGRYFQIAFRKLLRNPG